ncbi:MAG: lipoyl(octanoyl) transferase LipB [Solirubrobacterales bacterium]|nr:MAG: lipoyl(octanoyl) transferase LipB [Solirubrobacterales bacterium]
MSAELWVTRLETVSYADGLAFQNCLREARESGSIPDLLLLLEHWPVYTKGRRSSSDELPMGEQWYEMQGIEVAETDRGGLVTYHGPGQLVAYPIVDLGPYDDDIHAYVRQLETVMIEALADHQVPAQVFDGLTGVWTAGQPPIPSGEPGPQGTPVGPASEAGEPDSQARKIGSIGVHVSRGVTTHGFAINVNNDLQPFEWIVPCGIEYVRMTSLAREHRAEQDLDAFAATVTGQFGEVFDREPVELDAATLAARSGASLPAA